MRNDIFDPKWVFAAENGDQNALTNLYNSSYQNVYLTIKSMIRSDEDTVLDLLQDTYIKAFQSLDKLDYPSKFLGWIKAIARNTTLDYLKKSKAVLFTDLSDSEEEDNYFEVKDDDISHLPDVVMDRKETARLLREILDSLPEGQRAAISMYYYQDMTVKEIAAALGRSEGTIKAQLSNGRKAIEKKVREVEKKDGIRLYNLAPLPFFLWLLCNMDSFKVEADATVLEEVLQVGNTASGVSAAASNSTAKAASACSAKAASSTAVKGIAGKVISGVLAASVLIGGLTAGIHAYQNAHTQDNRTDIVAESSETGQTSSTGGPASADPMMLAYKAYAQIYSDAEARYGRYYTETFMFYDYDGINGTEYSHAAGVFYANLIDFTGDDIPELIFAYCSGMKEEDQFPGFQVEIWSWDEDEARQIYKGYLPYSGGDFADQSLVIAQKDERFFLVTRGGGAYDYIEFLSWDGNKFACEITFKNDYSGDRRINGLPVAEQEYTDTLNKWWENVEIYAPYGMGGDYWYGEDNSEMIENARQAIADTKAALGLGNTNSTQNGTYDYHSLITEYSSIISGTLSIEEAGIDLSGSGLWLSPAGFKGIDVAGYFIPNEACTFYYVIIDINGDQTDELIVRRDTDYQSDIIDIFTIKDGQPVWLIAGRYRDWIEICEGGIIKNIGNSGAEANFYSFYKIRNGDLAQIETAEENWGRYSVNGNECSEAEFRNVISKYAQLSLDELEWILFAKVES